MFSAFLYILFVGVLGLIFGICVGLILRDLQLQKGLKMFIKAFFRTTKKKWLRLINPSIDIIRVQRDQTFIDLPTNQKVRLVDMKAIEVITGLKQQLCSQFEYQIEAVYLFGSRARGDYQFDSDLDVGIFLAKPYICSDLLKKEIIYQSSELALKYGLFVQPRIFEQNHSRMPIDESEKYLAQIVLSYGIPV